MEAPQFFHHSKQRVSGLRLAVIYWAAWVLLLAGLAWGIHRYFEYRNHELDKRLEQLR